MANKPWPWNPRQKLGRRGPRPLALRRPQRNFTSISVTIDMSASTEVLTSRLLDMSVDTKVPASGLLDMVTGTEVRATLPMVVRSGFSSGFSTGFGPLGLSWTNQPDQVSSVEWRAGIQTDSSAPVWWGSLIRVDQPNSAAWNIFTSRDQASLIDLGASISRDQVTPTDWRSLFQVDKLNPVEWRASTQFNWTSSVEFGINVRPADVPSSLEWKWTTQADRTTPADWRGISQSDAAVQTDWRNTTQVDRGTFLDWVGAIRNDETIPEESLLGVSPASLLTTIEWGIIVLLSQAPVVEWLQVILANNIVGLEFGGATGTTRDVVVPMDFTSRPVVDTFAPVDARASLLGGLIAAAEVGVAVRADAAPQAEPGASIGLSITPPAAYAGAAGVGMAAQCDFMMTRFTAAASPMDIGAITLVGGPIGMDFGRALLSTSQATMDIQGTSGGLWTSQMEWETTIGLDLLSRMEFGSLAQGTVSSSAILPVEWSMSVPGLSIDVPAEWRLQAWVARVTKGASGSPIRGVSALSPIPGFSLVTGSGFTPGFSTGFGGTSTKVTKGAPAKPIGKSK